MRDELANLIQYRKNSLDHLVEAIQQKIMASDTKQKKKMGRDGDINIYSAVTLVDKDLNQFLQVRSPLVFKFTQLRKLEKQDVAKVETMLENHMYLPLSECIRSKFMKTRQCNKIVEYFREKIIDRLRLNKV